MGQNNPSGQNPTSQNNPQTTNPQSSQQQDKDFKNKDKSSDTFTQGQGGTGAATGRQQTTDTENEKNSTTDQGRTGHSNR